MKTEKEIIFIGPYKEVFEGYVAYKNSIGFFNDNEKRELLCLVELNEYLNERHPDKVVLDEETVKGYVNRKDSVSHSTRHSYECRIRQFALFMRNEGYSDIYILPEKHSKVTTDFVPYIYSKEEISRIFDATDRLESFPHNPNYKVFFQTIVRLLYCTGLRISEALGLKVEDVDFESSLLIVHSGKGNVSRLIPFNGYIHGWLMKYNKEAWKEGDTFFFESPQHGMRNRVGFGHTFSRVILPMAGIERKPDNTGPRVHDLRHTFACHSLDQMIRNGMDQFCALPYLSTYMGHKGIESTEKYLRLTPDHFQEICDAGHYIYEESVGDDDE